MENYVKFEDPKQPTVRFRLLSDFVLLGSQLKSIHSKSTVGDPQFTRNYDNFELKSRQRQLMYY